MSAVRADPGSFRDPRGRVYRRDGRIFRTVTERAAADWEFVRATGLVEALAADGLALAADEVDPAELGDSAQGARYVLEHPRIPFVSYPYEWCFSALKAAALLHLDVQLRALDAGVALSDATAYNVQFRGPAPVFIDHLSFRPYREGEIWAGYRQFCDQFLNPLLLRALVGVPHNAWYRGSAEGLSAADLRRVLPLRRKLSWNVLSNVVLHAALHRSAERGAGAEAKALAKGRLPRASFRAMLRRLRAWIARLAPAGGDKTLWRDYAAQHGYSAEEVEAKTRFVAAAVAETRPDVVWDMGCNTGDYAAAALDAGAGYVVGFDFDQGAVEAAFRRAREAELAFLPLVVNAADPSPDQGWAESERRGLGARGPADAVLALALVHHLAIGGNVPLDRLVDWLVGLAPAGVVEFVPKSDPMVERMMALREDVFDDYSEARFAELLAARARIVASETLPASGRRLIRFERRPAG